jgi:hypothetical protein
VTVSSPPPEVCQVQVQAEQQYNNIDETDQAEQGEPVPVIPKMLDSPPLYRWLLRGMLSIQLNIFMYPK